MYPRDLERVNVSTVTKREERENFAMLRFICVRRNKHDIGKKTLGSQDILPLERTWTTKHST